MMCLLARLLEEFRSIFMDDRVFFIIEKAFATAEETTTDLRRKLPEVLYWSDLMPSEKIDQVTKLGASVMMIGGVVNRWFNPCSRAEWGRVRDVVRLAVDISQVVPIR